MKTTTLKHLRTLGVFLLFALFSLPAAQAQLLKKLGKRAERAAERTIERRVEKETSEKTDQVLDSILEPGSKGPDSPVPENAPDVNNGGQGEGANSGNGNPAAGGNSPASGPKSLEVYSKFDFVPGDEILFFDDFSDDFVGDFPAKWNTNGSGEVVSFDDGSGKWFELRPGGRTYYIANLSGLPNDYTIEFDIESTGIDRQTSSQAVLNVILDDNDGFKYGSNTAWAYLPFAQYTPIALRLWNQIDGERTISNTLAADLRSVMLNRPHISIAVNEERYRLYVNEKKYVDVPRMIGPGSPLNYFKLQLNGTKDGKERVFVSNIKIAKGGEDLRRKLLAEGKISTNAILFDSGSANLQPTSMGVIRQISQVLMQDKAMRLQIVGHTDADGEETANQALSEARAAAVKDALITVYDISGERLEVAGKGESEPVSDNSSPNGKAQNRRVEFIKIQ